MGTGQYADMLCPEKETYPFLFKISSILLSFYLTFNATTEKLLTQMNI